ncbi:hypothetical protein GF377_01875 [candidate division GN15 bacterium]|nr:hypothetical protein [candidate division GN15 bacterium]
MKTVTIVLVILAVTILAASPDARAQSNREAVMLVDFSVSPTVEAYWGAQDGATFTDLLRSILVEEGVEIVARQRLDSILSEKGKEYRHLFEPGVAKEEKLEVADYIITGKLITVIPQLQTKSVPGSITNPFDTKEKVTGFDLIIHVGWSIESVARGVYKASHVDTVSCSQKSVLSGILGKDADDVSDDTKAKLVRDLLPCVRTKAVEEVAAGCAEAIADRSFVCTGFKDSIFVQDGEIYLFGGSDDLGIEQGVHFDCSRIERIGSRPLPKHVGELWVFNVHDSLSVLKPISGSGFKTGDQIECLGILEPSRIEELSATTQN